MCTINFYRENLSPEEAAFREHLAEAYDEARPGALAILDFGQVKALNKTVYSARVFGLPGFGGSITIAHRFFGIFRVASMLSKIWEDIDEIEQESEWTDPVSPGKSSAEV
jgi:hypothetical protein